MNACANQVNRKLAYRPSELADLLGVSQEFIRLQIKLGFLQAYKLGNKNTVILIADAEAWLKSRPIIPDMNSGESDTQDLEAA